MIDYSNEIFNTVATALRAGFDGIQVKGEYVSTPSRFPTVTVDETQNLPEHLDSGKKNKYARVTYRVQVFSNKEVGKRAEARTIYNTVDEVMQSMGFFAKTYTTTPAVYNSEIYCITATYEGVIGADGVIYRV